MPRYFFHYHDGRVQVDEEGTELASDEDARHEGVRMGAQIMRDHGAEMVNGEEYLIEAVREDGNVVLTLRFSALWPLHHD